MSQRKQAYLALLTGTVMAGTLMLGILAWGWPAWLMAAVPWGGIMLVGFVAIAVSEIRDYSARRRHRHPARGH